MTSLEYVNIEARPLPPMEQIRPGIWSIPVPLPVRWLRYTNVYVFETSQGPYLVDAGWDTEEAFITLDAGLQTIGTRVADVQGVLVTHIHPDHYGLAGRIRESSGAWIGLHPIDAGLIHDRYEEPDQMRATVHGVLHRAGVPIDFLGTLPGATSATSAHPDILVEDRQVLEIPGWRLEAIWTPGHSPGHLSVYDAHLQVMLTGDHVLPGITPNIPLHPQAGDNPLGDYLDSLARLESFSVDEAFPAHERRFSNFHERLTEIREHHEARLSEVEEAVRQGAETAWEIASQMSWSRPWERVVRGAWRPAVLEALAHIRYLERRGVLQEHHGEPSIWTVV
jgi:glyoxylase-like metal-dependent hydrolase (beta-lactamase superfamily II)